MVAWQSSSCHEKCGGRFLVITKARGAQGVKPRAAELLPFPKEKKRICIVAAKINFENNMPFRSFIEVY